MLKYVTNYQNKLNEINPPVNVTGSVKIGIPHMYPKIYESYGNKIYATNSIMINLRKVKTKIKQNKFVVFHFKL